jgi:hypothetical protein
VPGELSLSKEGEATSFYVYSTREAKPAKGLISPGFGLYRLWLMLPAPQPTPEARVAA